MSNALVWADPDPSIEEQSEHWRFDESEGGISLAVPWKADSEVCVYPTIPYKFGTLDHASGVRWYLGGIHPAATTEAMDFLNVNALWGSLYKMLWYPGGIHPAATTEAMDFLNVNALWGSLYEMLRIIEGTFSALLNIRARYQQDPDSEEDWVVVAIDLTSPREVAHDEYMAFTRKFVDAIPWEQGKRLRLVDNVLSG